MCNISHIHSCHIATPKVLQVFRQKQLFYFLEDVFAEYEAFIHAKFENLVVGTDNLVKLLLQSLPDQELIEL